SSDGLRRDLSGGKGFCRGRGRGGFDQSRPHRRRFAPQEPDQASDEEEEDERAGEEKGSSPETECQPRRRGLLPVRLDLVPQRLDEITSCEVRRSLAFSGDHLRQAATGESACNGRGECKEE